MQPVFGDIGNKVDRDQIHEVHEEDPDRNSQSQRADQLVLAVECFLHTAVCEIDEKFDEVLQSTGDARSCAFSALFEQPDKQAAEQN